jgi:hypothetical protein
MGDGDGEEDGDGEGMEMENVNKYGVLVAPKTIFNNFKGTNRSFKNNFFYLACRKTLVPAFFSKSGIILMAKST